jgi:hypothetical protein
MVAQACRTILAQFRLHAHMRPPEAPFGLASFVVNACVYVSNDPPYSAVMFDSTMIALNTLQG